MIFLYFNHNSMGIQINYLIMYQKNNKNSLKEQEMMM